MREREELDGRLGDIRGARLIRLGPLGARLGEIDRERPVVTVCRSGSRSAQAFTQLQKAGCTHVAHLAGGHYALARRRASG